MKQNIVVEYNLFVQSSVPRNFKQQVDVYNL